MKRSSNPKNYTLSAIILGYLMIGDYSSYDQNAIGNWFMTIGQILEANAAIQQAFESRYSDTTININSKQFKKGGSAYSKNIPILNELTPSTKEIEEIKKVLNDIIKKIDNL